MTGLRAFSGPRRSRHPLAVGLILAGLAVAGAVCGQDWRVAVTAGSVILAVLLARFPFAALLAVTATLFVGTPSLRITHAPGVVTQFFPAMLLLPSLLAGYLARAAAGSPHRPPPRRRNLSPLAPFVAAVVVLHLLALGWAPDTAFALGQLATLAFDALFFTVLVAAVSDARRLRAVLFTVLASAVAVCATMVCGALYDWAGSIPLGRGVSLTFELFSEERWGRIGGLCSANQAGGFLVFATFVALGLSRLYRRFARAGLCLLALLFLTFVVVSGSRGAILGFLGACGAFLLLHPASRQRLLSRVVLLILALTLAIAAGKPSFIDRMLVGFGYSGPLLFSEKKNTSESASNVSGSGARFRMWKDALSVMADRPEYLLLGLGPGGFIWHTHEPEVHSLWLAFFFDLGLAGGLTGILGLATLLLAVGQALRRAPPGPERTLFLAVVVAALAELGLHSGIDHDLTSPVSRFAWLYVAILAAALQVVRRCPARMEDAYDDPAPHPAPVPGPAVPSGGAGAAFQPAFPAPLPSPARAGNAGARSPHPGRARA